MTQDQITALAREYAEEKGKEMERKQSLPNSLIREVMEMDAKEQTSFLQWLLRRYALVEKDKLKEEYKKVCESVNRHSTTTGCLFFVGQKQTLESLFPEIAKEVEP